MAVADRGIGIDPAELGSIFEPYARARTARESGIRGTGLGLSIAREMALAHGGKLWATSDGPGHGTTFWLALPAHHSD